MRPSVPDEAGWESLWAAVSGGWRPEACRDRTAAVAGGREAGEAVACLTAPNGQAVRVHLAEIGCPATGEDGGALGGKRAGVERVVAMAVDLFPWDEIEALALALHQHGFRLLGARLPDAGPDSDATRP